MGFNYASEKRRFDAEWDALAKLYREAGMGEAEIQAMREFDWDWFKQRRTYENRIQVLPSEVIDDSDNGSNSTLLGKLPSLSFSFDETAFTSRYAWIDNLPVCSLYGTLCLVLHSLNTHKVNQSCLLRQVIHF